jgi:hypothetical protein
VCAALEAADVALAPRGESKKLIYPAADAVVQTGFALLTAASVSDPVRGWLRCIRRDFDRLAHLARKHNWTDETPVPPDVFGPMWPENLTPAWAKEVPPNPQG